MARATFILNSTLGGGTVTITGTGATQTVGSSGIVHTGGSGTMTVNSSGITHAATGATMALSGSGIVIAGGSGTVTITSAGITIVGGTVSLSKAGLLTQLDNAAGTLLTGTAWGLTCYDSTAQGETGIAGGLIETIYSGSNHGFGILQSEGAGTNLNLSYTASGSTTTAALSAGVAGLAPPSLSMNGNVVVNTRKTGWTARSGTPLRSGWATGSATLVQLAETLKALLDDLGLAGGTSGHGLIGT